MDPSLPPPLSLEFLLQVGAGLFLSHPEAMAWTHQGVRALSAITRRQEWVFVVRLVGALYLWVVDLPASERFHHSFRFGLLEHSLDVATRAIGDLAARWGAAAGMNILTAQERALWARVFYALGLFHDVGKVRDLEVRERSAAQPWDPLKEPLAFYRRKCGLAGTAPSAFRYRRGRGIRGHEFRSLPILEKLLKGPLGKDLSPFFEIAFRAYLLRDRVPLGSLPVPLDYLSELLSRWDRTSSRESRKALCRGVAGSREDVPQEGRTP